MVRRSFVAHALGVGLGDEADALLQYQIYPGWAPIGSSHRDQVEFGSQRVAMM